MRMPTPHSTPTRTALELIEESVVLLRSAPAATWAAYYAGAIPFIMALLYYWADMSQGAYSAERHISSALGLSLLFLWMKFCQSVFARLLRAQILGGLESPWTCRLCARIAVSQAILQPVGIFIMLIAAIITLPFGWCYAFYQTVTVLGTDEHGVIKTLRQTAWRVASSWPMNNHRLLAFLSFFAGAVFLNVATAMLLLPELLKMFLGIETMMSRSSESFLNTTFLASAAGITWLCIDPLIKACYTLRSFYVESIATGQDLRVGLKSLQSKDKPEMQSATPKPAQP